MFSYTTRSVYMLTIVVTLIIFYFVNNFLISMENYDQANKIKKVSVATIHFDKSKIRDEQIEKSINLNNSNQAKSWQIEIPKINLKANIAEGTTDKIMNEFVGHFESTPIYNGNVCLAAHNRGYPVNYFGKIKELQKGDKIVYTTIEGVREYQVDLSTIIKDVDWSNLKNTLDNRITLITCVEDEPEYRRCIQGIEIIESIVK